jgi:hypothetical protein
MTRSWLQISASSREEVGRGPIWLRTLPDLRRVFLYEEFRSEPLVLYLTNLTCDGVAASFSRFPEEVVRRKSVVGGGSRCDGGVNELANLSTIADSFSSASQTLH